MRNLSLFVVLVLSVLTASGFAQTSRLDEVKTRGRLVCGVNNQLPGFGNLDAQGNHAGFDVDFCRAIAAAVIGDASAVDFRSLTAQERFPALQSGDVDVLLRNTTWTSARDTSAGLSFGPIIFYDGQGFMVHRQSGISRLSDFDGRKICVQTGTTTELNLADTMQALDVRYEPVLFETVEQLTAAYDSGACDGWTTDKSGLVSRLNSLRTPADHLILDQVISKEPLAPAVRNGDDRWYDVVKWVVYGLMEAEEYGITSENVEQLAETSDNPSIRRILGIDSDNVAAIGLMPDGIRRAIAQVGNYGEIYTRNLGPFNISRGLNAQYYEGGLIYGMPFR